jgi:hypothetical protein
MHGSHIYRYFCMIHAIMKHFLFFLFFLICISIRAQNKDLIITNHGFKIYCKILSDDSLFLRYNIENHSSTLEIKKTEVKEYYYNLIKQKPKKEMPAPAKSRVDSISEDLVRISACAGFAFPGADFGDKNIQSEKAGLANAGYFFQGSLTFKLTKNIGICAAYHHQKNKLNSEVINRQIMLVNSGIPFTTETSHWIISGLYAGLYLEHEIKSKPGLSVFFQAMVGKPKYTSPSFVSSVAVSGLYFTVGQNSASTFAMGYIFGSGLFYKASDELGLSFSLNYLGGKANFSNVQFSNSQGASGTSDFSQRFTTINTQLALVICIGK